MNSWLYFFKTFGILREGDPDIGGGGGTPEQNHRAASSSVIWGLRPMATEKSHEHLDYLLTAGSMTPWPDFFFGARGLDPTL